MTIPVRFPPQKQKQQTTNKKNVLTILSSQLNHNDENQDRNTLERQKKRNTQLNSQRKKRERESESNSSQQNGQMSVYASVQ